MNSNLFVANAQTNSKNISYEVIVDTILPEHANSFVNVEKFEELCRIGCPNFNRKWSCPPFAPPYPEFINGWKYLYVFWFRVETDQFSYINNDYLKIKAANSILKSRADKFLRSMSKLHGQYISTGSCRLCKPCRRKIDLPCAHPETMSYSFEAMGVNVEQLVHSCFNCELLWYRRGHLPRYTSVIAGLLANEAISFEEIKSQHQFLIPE